MRTRGIALITLLLLPASAAASKRPPREPPPGLPPAEAQLSLLAPSPEGPWTLRLANEGEHRLRVAADVRLLELRVYPLSGSPVHCVLPRPLRPERFPADRALYLDPGQAYVESFDPRLFCFGKQAAALAPDALVMATYGFARDPFVVAGLVFPPEVRALRSLSAPPIVVGPRAEEAPPPSPAESEEPLLDENAPRLRITSEPFVDAALPGAAVVRVTITNIGHRPGSTLLRSKQIGFQIQGPDGLVTCALPPPTDAGPVNALTTLAPGASRSLRVRLRETCRGAALLRPGIYRLFPTFRPAASVRAPEREPPAGVVVDPRPTVLRLLTGPRPFHATPPIATRETIPADR